MYIMLHIVCKMQVVLVSWTFKGKYEVNTSGGGSSSWQVLTRGEGGKIADIIYKQSLI